MAILAYSFMEALRRGGETNDKRKKGKTAENMREKERRHQERVILRT
jgi:hypothetical protein